MKKLAIIIATSSIVGFLFAIHAASVSQSVAYRTLDASESVPSLIPLERTLSFTQKRQLAGNLGMLRLCDTSEGKELVSCVDEKLKKIATKQGARAGLDAVSFYAKNHPIILSYSHDLSHTVGLFALSYGYKADIMGNDSKDSGGFAKDELVFIDRMGKALVDCYSWGVMGCMHGVIEAAIAKLPKEKRTAVVRRACMDNPLIQSNQVYINHCLHWAGHGMAIFTDQTLEQSLTMCEHLSDNFDSEDVQLCLSGIFHSGTFPRDLENKYLDNIQRVYSPSDVYFPCQGIPKRFRRQCYNAVPGRSRDHDTQTIFTNCHAIPERDPAQRALYIQGCYDAASNILSVRTEPNAEAIIASCKTYAKPEYLPYCYAGALRYTFLRNPTQANREPARVCKLVDEGAKKLCYRALGSVINESYYSQDILFKLCKDMAEPAYYNDCVTLEPY